ncbi:DUF4190 domain-containing protein [Nonomuraea sp. NPDC049152]|uniref:DUF4190 domain-containing protein n=1 Tax=Nonomuraea sp. NPDC049152 TaxID=3154350 RepID=UPI0033C35866
MHPPYGDDEHRYVPYAAAKPTSGAAVASLIFGIFGLFASWCLFGIPSIVAIVLGHVATSQTRRGLRPGHGMAVAGLILGYVVVPAVIVTVAVIVTQPDAVADWVNAVFSWVDSVLNT